MDIWSLYPRYPPVIGPVKEERSHMFRNAVLHSSVSGIDEKDRNKGVTRYMSTKELMLRHIEGRKNLQLVEASDLKNVWLG